MDRIYRIRNGMDGRYAVERDGNLFWLEGDLFGKYRCGDEVKDSGLRFLAPVIPSKIDKKQSSNMPQLIFPIAELVEFVTFVMTLEPGDIIATGTPSGVGPVKPGDRVMVKVEGVGTLSNPVIAA